MNTRKIIRLQNYDYSTNGAYFITICTKDKRKIFWDNADLQDSTYKLSTYGIIVEKAIKNIPKHYPMINVDNYVIMPNHIHIILMIDNIGKQMDVPTISIVINQLKGYVSKIIGHSIWQSRFNDHVIRNEADYLKHLEYIENNPLKWELDDYF